MKTFTYKTRIYFHHTDAGGVVYHGNYLALAEEARTQWQLEFGLPEYHASNMLVRGEAYVVRSVNIEYLKPIMLGDEIEIKCYVERLDAASGTFVQEFWRGDVKLTVLTIRVLMLDMKAGRPMRFPNELREKYLEYLKEEGEKK